MKAKAEVGTPQEAIADQVQDELAEAKTRREAVQHDPVNVPSDAPEWARQTVHVASEPQERDETRDIAEFPNDEKVGATYVLVDDVYDVRASHDPTKDFAARPEEEFPARDQPAPEISH